jgi:hypothetical protein
MTTTTVKVSRRKLSLLELASELDNVSKACKVMGYSRQQFYEIRRNFPNQARPTYKMFADVINSSLDGVLRARHVQLG